MKLIDGNLDREGKENSPSSNVTMVIHMHEPAFTPKLNHIHLIYKDPNKPLGVEEFNTCNVLC